MEYGIKIATNKFTELIWEVRSRNVKYIGDDSFADQQGNWLNFLAQTIRDNMHELPV